MDRKDFLKKSVIASAAAAFIPSALEAATFTEFKKHSTYDKLMDQVGFNHIPNTEIQTMNTVLHKADSRGHADHGWLKSNHSFSFANYHNPQRMNFGVLRVLNDDFVEGGKGFGTHPHDNMEIVSIPLEGNLKHQDNMGNMAVIKSGDVQVMSAGTGIQHSEFNESESDAVKFLQIWVFPNKRNVEPRYDQITLPKEVKQNTFLQVVSPNPNDDGVWVNQNAWFHIGTFSKDGSATYKLKDPSNGLYAFMLEGDLNIAGQPLNKRDGFGIWNVTELNVTAQSDARVLFMEVPMNI
ncbi:MAG: redox-sensitive bicupin YhaK (pirin superfamily) [Flavobacteriales bacterium]|jgi:redox-sensitive bicupin YhaK (pirin superfamily)